MKRLLLRHPVSIAVGSLTAIVSLAAIAQAATDTVYKYRTPKTGAFTINVMAMAPNRPGGVGDYDISFGGGTLTSNVSGCFSTGVHLPHGATITAVQPVFTSNFNVLTATYGLIRQAITTVDNDDVAGGSISAPASRKLFNATPAAGTAVVNNIKYGYGFGICLYSDSTTFHGARIIYTYTHAGE